MTATTQEALAARRELLGNTHLRVARTLDALARVIHERNRAADALPLAEEALKIRRNASGEANFETRSSIALREAIVRSIAGQ